MSIKGIDNQIMVHRVTDYTREASVQNKRDEFAQVMQSQLGKAQVQHEKQQVQRVASEPKAERLEQRAPRKGKQQPDKKKKQNKDEQKNPQHVDILI